jgi:hypothetical protein
MSPASAPMGAPGRVPTAPERVYGALVCRMRYGQTDVAKGVAMRTKLWAAIVLASGLSAGCAPVRHGPSDDEVAARYHARLSQLEDRCYATKDPLPTPSDRAAACRMIEPTFQAYERWVRDADAAANMRAAALIGALDGAQSAAGSLQGLAEQNQRSSQMLIGQAQQFPRFQPPEPVAPVGVDQGWGSVPPGAASPGWGPEPQVPLAPTGVPGYIWSPP